MKFRTSATGYNCIQALNVERGDFDDGNLSSTSIRLVGHQGNRPLTPLCVVRIGVVLRQPDQENSVEVFFKLQTDTLFIEIDQRNQVS